MIYWIALLLAGAMEVVWVNALARVTNGTPAAVVVTILAILASFGLLTFALREIPAGTGYATWTGTGAIGTLAVGAWLGTDSITAWRAASALAIVAGIVGLRLTTPA